MKKDVKKRKWYLFAVLLVVYSSLRLILTFMFEKVAVINRNIEILENFQVMSVMCGVVLFILCISGIIVLYTKIIKDLSTAAIAREINYFFISFIVYILFKCSLDIFTAFRWESQTFYLSQQIQRLKGEEIMLGHPIGIITALSIGIAIILVLVCSIFSIALQVTYNNKKKSFQA